MKQRKNPNSPHKQIRVLIEGLNMKRASFLMVIIFACILLFSSNIQVAKSYGNGGYSADPANPDYGTHDWVAQHALDWLPTQEKQYITDNLAARALEAQLC